MKHACGFLLLLMLSPCGVLLAQESNDTKPAPLFKNLGKLHFPVTTKSKMAQKYVDQGMILAYGFNHHEAFRSFKAAAKLDPDCAMAYWGMAWVLGPNINAPMKEKDVPEAYEAAQKALKLADKVSEREQAYINALAKRYSEKPLKDRKKLDQDFAAAMRAVWKQYPEDLDAGTIFAEALMDTTPWNYWDAESRPREVTDEILQTLETVMRKNPNHPGANHYYIHAVESSAHPEKGLPCAYRLLTLCPDAGHLVHMPAHIFLKLGMYNEAAQANEKAIAADEGYITQCKAQGFYPLLYYSHNVHFLCYALCMEGRSDYAIKMGMKTGKAVMHGDGHAVPMVQWLKATPVFVLARFGKWQQLLDLPMPHKAGLFEKAMLHYGRGLALIRTQKLEDASEYAKELAEIANGKGIDALEVPDFPGKSVAQLANTLLQAEIEGAKDNRETQIEILKRAVKLQDALPYMEPPFWFLPVRQALGAAYLKSGQLELAEKTYREDLKKNPKNGWSLFGLLQCLRMQGKTAEADEVQREFQQAWQRADVTLTASWF